MLFNQHSNLDGLHAFLSPSKHSWINYSDEKLIEVYKNEKAKEMGTRLHSLAAEMIELGRKCGGRDYFSHYVNDAIGFHMSTEVCLYYSDLWFGHADAIRYDERRTLLRIHDLKTGVSRVYMDQLYQYAALFCLEYHIPPGEIEIETRIYQINKDIWVEHPTATDIAPIIDKGKHFVKLITERELKNLI